MFWVGFDSSARVKGGCVHGLHSFTGPERNENIPHFASNLKRFPHSWTGDGQYAQRELPGNRGDPAVVWETINSTGGAPCTDVPQRPMRARALRNAIMYARYTRVYPPPPGRRVRVLCNVGAAVKNTYKLHKTCWPHIIHTYADNPLLSPTRPRPFRRKLHRHRPR